MLPSQSPTTGIPLGLVSLFSALLLNTVFAMPLLCADELALTNNVRRNQNFPVGFRVEPPAAVKLFDGSLTDGNSLGMPEYGALRVTFDEPVVVSKVTISHYNDPLRTYNGGQDATVQRWRDEAPVGELAMVSLEEDAKTRLGTDDHLVLAANAEARFPAPPEAPVTSVTIAIRKKPGAVQTLLREVEIWGLPERATRLNWRALPATVAENTFSSLRVEWDNPPLDLVYLRARYRKQRTTAWRSACFARSPGLILGLEPDTTYEVALEARVKGAGVAGEARPAVQRLRLPGALEVRTVGDVFGTNFFPGGGGVHQPHEDEREVTLKACRLMREAGIRHGRWWVPGPGGAELFAEHGMSLLPNTDARMSAARLKRLAAESGLFVYDTANEPDFHSVFAEEYVADLRKMRAATDEASAKIALIGPTFGGELEGPGADYLDACYRAGMKNMLQALDLHPYTKYATPTPPGGLPGGPEGVLHSLARAQEVLARNGEADLAIVASECGHPTSEGEWFMPPVTFEQQAQRIVRTHLLLIGAGLRRIWFYSFWDEGTDRANPEHNFGIVDWHGKPKPAYHAYKAMVALLSDTRCEGLQAEAEPPLYAVRFRHPQGFLTALWDSGGESEVTVTAKGGVDEVLDLFGASRSGSQIHADRISLIVDESVRYLRSTAPLRVSSQLRRYPPVEPQVQMALNPSTVALAPGETRAWQCRVRSEFGVPVEVRLSVPRPWGGAAEPKALTLAAGESAEASMDLTAPADARKQIVSWDVKCEFRKAGTDEPWRTLRRAIFFQVLPPNPRG